MSIQASIEKFWYSPSKLKLLFYPLSVVFALLARFKAFLYKINFLKVNSTHLPVIVVGNITVGGTGKTPFIRYLVKQLSDRGLKVAIVSRGYKSMAPCYPHIVNQSDSVETVGDEAYMQYHYMKNKQLNVPMVIDPNRSRAIKCLSDKYSLDVVISDDGLQHYAMARDFEIVMLDAKRIFGNRLMLPFGPLREPISRLKQVDYVIQNGINNTDEFSLDKSLSSSMAQMKMGCVGLVQVSSKQLVSTESLQGKKVSAIAGIGHPNRFFESLSENFELIEKQAYPDHHAFKLSDFNDVKGDIIIMTEKDAVKCEAFAKDNWYYLLIETFLDNQDFNRLYDLIKSNCLIKKRTLNEGLDG